MHIALEPVHAVGSLHTTVDISTSNYAADKYDLSDQRLDLVFIAYRLLAYPGSFTSDCIVGCDAIS